MELIDVSIPYSHSSSIKKLYLFGDQHLGTIHCVEDHIKKKVSEIHDDKDAYWLGMGDYGEFIAPDDPRYDPNYLSIAEWVEPDNVAECQVQKIVKLFEPIKDKCIGLLYGNHEEAFRIHKFGNVAKNICDRLGVRNLGYSCFVRFYFNRKNSNETHLIKGCFTHGRSSAITEGAKAMALMRFMKSFDADIYGYAHVHDYMPKSFSRIGVTDIASKGKIKERVAVGTLTGCWFRTYTQGIIASYGERKCYPPTEIGCAKFTIEIDEMFWDVNRSI